MNFASLNNSQLPKTAAMKPISQPFKIKKRASELENEVIKKIHHPRVLPFAYGDRFIPRRYNRTAGACENDAFNGIGAGDNSLLGGRILLSGGGTLGAADFRPLLVAGQNDSKSDGADAVDILDMKKIDGYWQLNGLRDCLNAVFELDLGQQRVLDLHDWLTECICRRTMNMLPSLATYHRRYRNVHGLDWPCVPRTRPIAFTNSSHDLPGFHRFSHMNIISWSPLGRIAASFGVDLVVWMPRSDDTVVYRLEGIKTLEYSANGKELAASIKRKDSEHAELQVWNVEEKGIYTIESYEYKSTTLNVHCITWDPHNRFILCGMSNGHIYIHRFPTLEVFTVLTPHTDCISEIKFSKNTKYFASTDLSGYVLIWELRKMRPFIKCLEVSDCLIAWHPWKEDDIIIATTLPAKIRLINVATKSVVAYYRRVDNRCRIDAISFNPLSAELVVSLSMVGEHNQVTSEILVMASMSRVVDTLSVHEKSVYFLMWDPDGTQLATAGDDETLNIWNFFAYPNKNYLPPMIKKHFKKPKGDRNPFGPTQALSHFR